MKPEIDVVLRSVMGKLLAEVAPAISDSYVRSNVEVMAALMVSAAEEYERAADVRVEENRAMRRIFAEAARFVEEARFRARLEEAAAEQETSLRVSELNSANDRYRTLLIELHAFVEERSEEWARTVNRAIWQELRASAERRAISFYPL